MEHNREALIEIITYHYRKTFQYCACGWGELGKSHPEHVVDVYEQVLSESKLFGGNEVSDD